VTVDNPNPLEIRYLDNSTDLIPVADLIETCFSEHMDADGYEYLNHIRKAARDTQFLRWIPGSRETVSYPLHGFVCVLDGKVVGNLTLIPVLVRDHWRYLIVNVAVHPDYRRRGIARQLTVKGLEHIRNHGASSAWLQVRNDNQGAIDLYKSLGFQERAVRTIWNSNNSQPLKDSVPDLTILPRKDQEWALHHTWLRHCYPPEVSWHLPISFNKFKPTVLNKVEFFFSDIAPKHWTCHYRGSPIGFLTWEPTHQSADMLWLALNPERPELMGMAANGLLRFIRQQMPSFRTLTINFTAQKADEAFIENGFVRQNSLIWMEVPFQASPISMVRRILDRLVVL
jgi:ribosomal protein S18 acetylase RimI-like enzyme